MQNELYSQVKQTVIRRLFLLDYVQILPIKPLHSMTRYPAKHNDLFVDSAGGSTQQFSSFNLYFNVQLGHLLVAYLKAMKNYLINIINFLPWVIFSPLSSHWFKVGVAQLDKVMSRTDTLAKLHKSKFNVSCRAVNLCCQATVYQIWTNHTDRSEW